MQQGDQLDELIDAEVLSAWLDENIPELGSGALRADLLQGGASNAVIALHRGGEVDMVLRRGPARKRPDSDRIIAREARVLQALNVTDVPHAHVYGWSDDQDIIGASFYVMSFIDGWTPRVMEGDKAFDAPYDRSRSHRRALAFELVGGIIALANVDYQEVGLSDFGKPENFLDRQVDRWLSQFDAYRKHYDYEGRDIPGLAYVADWLRANTPAMSPAGIIHGDYGFGNVMFANGDQARLLAMIDWELSTIGDPLLDLAWVLYLMRGEDYEADPKSAYYPVEGFPCREELAEYYADGTGRDISHIAYYLVLAQFKLAAILEGQVARAAVGKQTREMGDWFARLVTNLIAEAQIIARREG